MIEITQVCRDPVSPDAFRSESCKDRSQRQGNILRSAFVVEYSWFTLWPNYPRTTKSFVVFEEWIARVRGFSRRALSISRFDDDDHPVGKRVKAKKLHGQFFLFNSILPFPFLPFFLSLSLSSFRFRGFRFVKNEYTKLSTLSSKRNNERDILKLTRPVGVSRWPNCGEPNEFRSCRINCVCSGPTHMDLHKLYASKPFCRVEPDSISRSITTIVLLRLPSSNRTRNKKHRLGIEMDLWKRDVKE